MGRHKATLPLSGGDTFLSRIVQTFHDAGVDDVVVVVGHDAEHILAALSDSPVCARVRFVPNPDYELGQFSSLVKGLNIVDRPGVVGALLTLVDVPLVSAATIRAVVERYWQTRVPIVRPTRQSPVSSPLATGDRRLTTEHGHPVFIDRSLFDEIRRANASQGAKRGIRAHASPAGDIPIDDDGAFLDIDTPEQYERVIG